MSWMIESDKLDVDQKHFIFEEVTTGNNIWINGFAGSGKSILLVHAIIEKLKKDENASICIVVFTHSLIEMFELGMNELGIDGNIKPMTYYEFQKNNTSYDYIFCDEVQDLPKSILKDMKERSKQLILAGDSNQSIYDINPKTNEPTVTPTEIVDITNSNEYILSTIYRLTKSIINVVSLLLPKIDIFSAKTDRTKQDITVKLCNGENLEMEVEYIIKEAEELTSIDESLVIILPKHDDIINFINIVLDIKKIAKWNVTKDRYNGYKMAHEVNCVSFDENYVLIDEDCCENTGYRLISEFLKSGKKFDAVFTTDDLLAIGVLKKLNEEKIKNITVTGFNNIPLASYQNPPLASMDINAQELGYRATKLLIDSLEGIKNPNKHFIVNCDFIERESFY